MHATLSEWNEGQCNKYAREYCRSIDKCFATGVFINFIYLVCFPVHVLNWIF